MRSAHFDKSCCHCATRQIIEAKEETTMKRVLLAAVSIALLGFGLAPRARADQWDKRTTLKVNETIQVPGGELLPGVYIVKLLNSTSNRHIVQIYNAEETQLQTTILAIPNDRLKVTAGTVFTFWEMPPGQPRALRAWFYPGDNFGQEFAYPKVKATEIAEVAHVAVPTTEAQKPEEMKLAPYTRVAPPPKAEAPVDLAQLPPSARIELPTELPKTASPTPLIGLAGVLSLLMFVAIRTIRAS
jgi:hypothetical protein